jgi:outer membrane protein assembly factor BamB
MKSADILWKVEMKDTLTHSPVVSRDGQLYCSCGDGRVYAFDRSGKNIWDYQRDSSPHGAFTRGNQGMVLSNGRLAISGLAYVAIGKRNEETKLMVFEPSGQLAWQQLLKGDGACAFAETSDGTILFSAPGKNLVAFDTCGERKWQFKAGGKIITAPCVGPNGIIHVGASDGKVYAVGPDGDKQWEFHAGGPDMSELAITNGGDICFGTYAGELVVLDSEGHMRMRSPLVTDESSHFGSPVVCSDGTIVMSSYRAIHAISPSGNKKWSYQFRSDIYMVCPALAADGTLYIAADGDRLEAIDAEGKKSWELLGIPTGPFTKPTRPTLTADGILYLASDKWLYAIQCPSVLADSPWPMVYQNPQGTNRANSKFSQPIHYGTLERPTIAPVEIRSARPKPMPEKPFTKEEVLQQLSAAEDFPTLDNGYIYPATVRLSAFRDSLRWALVIEVVGWNNRSSDHEALQDALYCYGNWLNQSPGLADDGFLTPTRDGDESCTFDDQDVDPEARDLYVRNCLVKIPRVRKHYASLGIKLEEPGVIKGHELLRALVAEHRDLFLASDDELIQRVGDLPLVLRLHEWRHPYMSEEEKPSQCETFQMLADVLVSGDPTRYQPEEPPNTHWKHWPMAGQL